MTYHYSKNLGKEVCTQHVKCPWCKKRTAVKPNGWMHEHYSGATAHWDQPKTKKGTSRDPKLQRQVCAYFNVTVEEALNGLTGRLRRG